MGRIVFCIYIFLVIFYLDAKSRELKIQGPPLHRHAIISGALNDSTKGIPTLVRISVWNIHQNIVNYNPQTFTLVTLDGRFQFTIDADNPLYVKLESSNAPNLTLGYTEIYGRAFNAGSIRFNTNGVLIEPGDSIYMDLRKCNSYYDIDFSGKGAYKLKCIQSILRATNQFENPTSVENQKRIALRDSVRSMILNTIEKYKPTLSPIAIVIIKAQYLYMLGGDISEIYIATGGFYSAKFQEEYNKQLQKEDVIVSPNHPGAMYSDFYSRVVLNRRILVLYSLSRKIDYQSEIITSISNEQYFDAVNAYLKGEIKDKVLTDYLVMKIKLTGLQPDMERCVNKFLITAVDNSFRWQVEIAYKDFLRRGDRAFKFHLPDTTGKIINMDDFTGKVVLIDFMFNGCPGCKSMVPSLSALENEIRANSQDVIFISVSIDKDIDGVRGWKKAIGVYSVAGSIQLYTNGQGIDHSIVKYYNVIGFPTLVLIDKDGQIISSRAPDPRMDSGFALKALIYDTLNKSESAL